MPESKLIFKDGSIIENGRAGYTQGALWCYVPGYSMAQVAAVFLDPQKTDLIVFQYAGNQDEYNGFTNCVNMTIDVDGLAHVCMERQRTENETKDGAENGAE